MSTPDQVSHAKLTYTIVVAETLTELVEQVHQNIVVGWRCVGGPFSSIDDGVCQAMTRDPFNERLTDLLAQLEGAMAVFIPTLIPKPPCPKCGAPSGSHYPACEDAFPPGDLFGQRNRSN